MPPAVGLVLLPTPIVIDLTAVIFTPAEVKSLSGIFHCFQPGLAGGRRIRIHDRLALAGVVLDRQVHGARPSCLPAAPAPISAICQAPVTVPVVVTLENSAAVATAASWLHTARPIRTGSVIVIVWASPNWVQVLPSGEMEPVKLLPVRSTFTQYGAAIAGGGLVVVGRGAAGGQPPLEAGAVAGRCRRA